jgi:hypothetical protein
MSVPQVTTSKAFNYYYFYMFNYTNKHRFYMSVLPRLAVVTTKRLPGRNTTEPRICSFLK